MVLQVTTKELSTLTEEQLLHRLAAGERNAFWLLWQQHRDYLFACCLKWMNGNSTEAEDLLSQGMVKAWENAPKYAEKIANFKFWLRTLIRNLWLDIKRRQGADQVEDIEVYAAQEDLGMVCGNQTPQSALEHDEKNMVIRAAIEELPAKMRETFIGHFYEELSYQQIGEQQDISYQNVCKRISMARAILVKQLRGYFIGEAETKPDTAKVAATPAKCKKAAKVEPILTENQQLDFCVNTEHPNPKPGEETDFLSPDFCVNTEHPNPKPGEETDFLSPDFCFNTNHADPKIEKETDFLSPSPNQKYSLPYYLLPLSQKYSLVRTHQKTKPSSFLSPNPNQKLGFYLNIEHLKPKLEKPGMFRFCLNSYKKTSSNTGIDST